MEAENLTAPNPVPDNEPPSPPTPPAKTPLTPAEEAAKVESLRQLLENKRPALKLIGTVADEVEKEVRHVIPSAELIAARKLQSNPFLAAQEAEATKVQREAVRKAGLIRACIPPHYHNETLNPDLRPAPQWIPENDRETYDTYRSILGRLRKSFGMVFLIGDRGTGKTAIACGMLIDGIADGVVGLYTEAIDIHTTFHDAQREGKSERVMYKKYNATPLLVIDEVHERVGTDYDNRIIGKIIRDRYNSDLPTVLISNESKEDFEKNIGQSAVSRGEEKGMLLECNWKSLRSKK